MTMHPHNQLPHYIPPITTTIITILYSFLLILYHTTHAFDTNQNSSQSTTPDNNDNLILQTDENDDVLLRESTSSTLWMRLRTGPDSVTLLDLTLFGVLILLGLELLNFLTKFAGRSGWMGSKLIPVRGKHLDDLSVTDLLFIGMNKAATPPFVYFLLRYMYFEPNGVWDWRQMTLMNVIVPLPVIFVLYDFFYVLLHGALHIKCVYGYIHKHHHHQKAPSRANVDAVNVHPLEFFLGEYNHLWVIYLYCHLFNQQLHIVSVLLILIIGGALASINHTRYDVVFDVLGIVLYDSKNHDVHHRIPQSNYGQYSMVWDVLFGTYRCYNPKDRINPKAQLDPKTGKSLEYRETIGKRE